MQNDESNSKLPLTLKDVDFDYEKPKRKNELIPSDKYDKIDTTLSANMKLGSNGVGYVPEESFSSIFQTTNPKAAYIFEHQIPDNGPDDEDKIKRTFDGEDYAHSSYVVALLDRKSQEVRDAGKQALFQYARDSIENITDSPQAQEVRRKLDAFTNKVLPTLRNERGTTHDEITGEPLEKGAAFHHVRPKEIHTDPEDVVDPSKGENLNRPTHNDVHRNNINDGNQYAEYKSKHQNK